MTATPVAPIAFFDVDETLINTKSMFDFLRFHLGEETYIREAERLRAMAQAGADRSEVNRAYYRLYAGALWSDLLAQGRRWYEEIRSGRRIGPPLIASTLAALRHHRTAGHRIALVSGSFLPCLAPLAEHLGADTVLCTDPVRNGQGKLTGEVIRPVIGPHKVAVAREAAAREGVPMTDCYAYGDHASDLDLLRAAGRPHVVGGDPLLMEHAHRYGWPVLSTAVLVTEPTPTGGLCAVVSSPCGGGCSVAAWSMPDDLAADWECTAAAR
ncbi:HAD-IB family hydrolase [Streptomyces calidiresistens]|uniref:HAD-IB family hydrolase n=1 Tax=Streptomyces calidiresistens TaxID=1485586 RepID=A0A7W3XWA4_9ACTN|nr:HAD family hydrolase [Streptomyces calidiresistens]MBB0229865.1 HAD-IB family hydrolase [Streptomyces calidiresistens]